MFPCESYERSAFSSPTLPSRESQVEAFRRGLLSLRSRRFGAVGEMLVQGVAGFRRAGSLHHDLFDEAEDDRVEVKLSAVNEPWSTPLRPDTLLQCLSEASERRSVRFDAWRGRRFDCSFLQIKRSCFDVLFYCMLFEDVVLIFRMEASRLLSAAEIREAKANGRRLDAVDVGFTEKQHYGGGEGGQFRVTERTLELHLERFLHSVVSYERFLSLFEGATGDPEWSAAYGRSTTARASRRTRPISLGESRCP